MLRLTLLCHAMAPARPPAFADDAPLQASLRAAVAALRTRLPRAEHYRASPALRARQTAEALGIAADAEPALADLDLGRWTGRPLADIHEAEPEAAAAWLADPAAASHGGESRAALQARVAAWLDHQADGRGHMLCVTHAAVIRAAVLHALGAPADAFFRLDVEPLSLADLRHDGRRWAVRSLNLPLGD
ncbi:histidine phosphatase family protein [Xanthobacter sp. KR7-65]|uniref:histidine phosphatase family protein n=1 Tax=Xanthobacter sp. KR7-65 TaxID=3156612 RepID=UPI0032B5EE66